MPKLSSQNNSKIYDGGQQLICKKVGQASCLESTRSTNSTQLNHASDKGGPNKRCQVI